MIGFASWIAAGVLAFALGFLAPPRRARAILLELSAAMFASLAAGMAATALDFGGWNELDPRAAAFAFLVALAAIGLVRLVAVLKRQ